MTNTPISLQEHLTALERGDHVDVDQIAASVCAALSDESQERHGQITEHAGVVFKVLLALSHRPQQALWVLAALLRLADANDQLVQPAPAALGLEGMAAGHSGPASSGRAQLGEAQQPGEATSGRSAHQPMSVAALDGILSLYQPARQYASQASLSRSALGWEGPGGTQPSSGSAMGSPGAAGGVAGEGLGGSSGEVAEGGLLAAAAWLADVCGQRQCSGAVRAAAGVVAAGMLSGCKGGQAGATAGMTARADSEQQASSGTIPSP